MSRSQVHPDEAEVHIRAPVVGATHAENTHWQNADTFFQNYSTSLLDLIRGVDSSNNSAHQDKDASQILSLSDNFVCIDSCGNVTNSVDVVMEHWHQCLARGWYSEPTLSRISLQKDIEHNGDKYECIFKLGRSYSGRHALSRDMLALRVIATFLEGRFRVIRHVYQELPPIQLRGIRACSQISQDLWVLKIFSALPLGGFFLEIGANHPEELSNTFLLEKAFGWRGVSIDPFPVGDWSCRASVELVRNAVGPDGSKLRFIAPGHVLGGLVDHVDMPRVKQDVAQADQCVVEVETRSISSILKQARPGGEIVPKVIHYLSLDTEGSEYEILCSFPFDQYTVLAITVEHNWKEPWRTQIRSLLESRGYFLDMCVEHDDFFILANFQEFVAEAPKASDLSAVSLDVAALDKTPAKEPASSKSPAETTTQTSRLESCVGHQVMQAHDRAVTAICVTHDAVYTTSVDGLLKRWKLRLSDTQGHHLIAQHVVSLGSECLSMTFMSEWIFCGLSNGDVRAFSKAGVDTILSSRSKDISAMMVNEGMLLTGSSGGLVTCWQSKEETGTFEIRNAVEGLFSGQVHCLAVLVGALWIGADDGVCIVEFTTGQNVRLEPRKKVVSFLEFRACMITAYDDGAIMVFDGRGIPKHSQQPFHAGPIACIVGVELGPTIICGHLNGWLTAIDVQNFESNKSWQALASGQATCMCTVNRRGTCIIGTDVGELHILESSAGQECHQTRSSGEHIEHEKIVQSNSSSSEQEPEVSKEKAQDCHEPLPNSSTAVVKETPTSPEVSAGEPQCISGHLCRLSADSKSHPRGWKCHVCGARKRSEHWACDICNERLCLDCFPWYLPGVRCFDKKESDFVNCRRVKLKKGATNGSVFVTFEEARHRDLLLCKFSKDPPVLGGISIEMKHCEKRLAESHEVEQLDTALVTWRQPERQGACKLLITTLGHYLDRLCDSLSALDVET